MRGVELFLRTTVIKIDGSEQDELRSLLLKAPSATEKRTTNEYESFRIGYSGGSIIGYASGKVVITSEPAVQLVREVLQKMGVKEADYDLVIGSDEVEGGMVGPHGRCGSRINSDPIKRFESRRGHG